MARFSRPKALEMVEVEFRETLALAYLLVRSGGLATPLRGQATSFWRSRSVGSVRQRPTNWLQVP